MTTADEPFPASDFDAWAKHYDASVETDQYPFTRYREVLRRIVEVSEPSRGQRVLDLGTGTGNLALPFCEAGCEVWGSDFSQAMLAQARRKLAGAHLVLHDLRDEPPKEMDGPFDRIVSAYVFHHFPAEEKVRILQGMWRRLAAGGRMAIGDIAFQDHSALERARAEAGEAWDEEYYWVAEEILPLLKTAGMRAEYEQVSRCAGVFTIGTREPGDEARLKP